MKVFFLIFVVVLALPLCAGEACRIRAVAATTAWGTCVPITEHFVATARHVVEAGRIEVEYSGAWHAGELVAGDQALDVALIRVAGVKMKAIKLADEVEITVEASDEGGPVIRHAARPNCSYVFGGGAQGNSGAPVMRGRRLIGIVTGRVVGGGYAFSDVAAVRRLLKGVP